MNDEQFVAELKLRVANPAVTDAELLSYINSAKRDVNPALYSTTDYDAQILDTACVYLCDDNKFPEIQQVSQDGITTSFAANDPLRFQKRIAGRRQAAWMQV